MEATEPQLISLLREVSSVVPDLTTAEDLFGVPAFIALYERPAPYARVAAQVYAHPDVSTHEKRILGYAMQRLETEALVRLLRSLLELTRTGQLDPSLLEEAAFPPLNWGARLPMEYNEPAVAAFLRELAADPALSATLRRYVQVEVLTGVAREQVLDLRELGQLPPGR